MLRNLKAKWILLVCGSVLAGFNLGQCIGNFLEDAIVFRIVD